MNDFIKLYERRNRIKTFLMALTALLLSLLAISVFTSCVYDDYGPGTANDDSETYLNLSFLTSSPTESRAAMSRAETSTATLPILLRKAASTASEFGLSIPTLQVMMPSQ